MSTELGQVVRIWESVRTEVGRVLVGQEAAAEGVMASVLAGGHVLLEGVPGLAKTLLARAMARALGGEFRRVQFTPDLMPSDLLGTEVFFLGEGRFELKKGPIFTDILLADEINRSPPKTQSALLESMQERSVSIGGTTHPLSPVFTVLATQNPVEYEGTYPLPEAQLDRFMVKIVVDYPEEAHEVEILRKFRTGADPMDFERSGLSQATDLPTLLSCRRALEAVRVEDDVLRYITAIVRLTRQSPSLLLGASPRAAIALLLVSRALVAMRGKDYLSPDEVKDMAVPVLRHRVILTPEAQVEGIGADRVVADLLAQAPVPR